MHWNFYLPIAGHSLNIFMLLGLGNGGRLLSGLTGVGGGFLMTPLLIMAGIPPDHSSGLGLQPDRCLNYLRNLCPLSHGQR